MKTNNKELASIQLNQATEQLKEMGIGDIINIYNNYADINRYELVYSNDEDKINVLFDSAWAAISLSNHDGYRNNDDYFTYNGCGLMSSFNNISDENCPIDMLELAQWLINEDKLLDCNIKVTTIDDILASIEDNITDNEKMRDKLIIYSDIELDCYQFAIDKGYICYSDYSIAEVMNYLRGLDYNELNDVINHLGIDYN